MRAARRIPHRRPRSLVPAHPATRGAAGLLLVAGLLLGWLGAGTARAETPAQRIARLRAQAAKVQATIDRMNDRTEVLVEQFNANQEALDKTIARQRETARQLTRARGQLAAAQAALGERIRSIYINGPVSGLEQLLEVRTLGDAVVMTRYQQSATESDAHAIASVEASRTRLARVASALTAQQREQEAIRSRLAEQRKDIEAKLAEQRRYLDRLTADVKRAVEQERQRQEELRRQALERKLAAERAAREQAAREAAAQAAEQQQTTTDPAPSGPSSAAEQAIAFARAQIGDPYQWGATGPDSWDCSGLTMKAYESAGISIPRTAAQQWTVGQHIHDMGDLQPGDLVFYAYDLSDASTIHHVGLYIGDGMMIEAPRTGEFVRTASINRSDYFGGTRVSG
ncbi:MAG TPA: NlpC/P60 family protein [Actinomycetes bacterium]|nr:NlpC/P60 family protein [Actinomycetes bacterium]